LPHRQHKWAIHHDKQLVESKFYQNQIFIECLPKPKVSTKTKFSLLKTFDNEINFIIGLYYVYIGPMFWGLG
jgi:hypothetical protein